MISIVGYGTTSAAGVGVSALWAGLTAGTDFSRPIDVPGIEAYAYLWPRPDKIAPGERIVSQLLLAWQEARSSINPAKKLGVIFASAKGALEDYIWDPTENQLASEPMTPVLEQFIRRAELNPRLTQSVSNACASSTAALWLADRWLTAGRVEQVIVLAADYIGPFVIKGFHSLKSLSPTKLQPFSATRDGLRLGEAAAVLCLERGTAPSKFPTIEAVGLDTDGLAVTRPTPESLERAIAISGVGKTGNPDLIIAHGTGTQSNDETEDLVFHRRFGGDVPITATKWCVGHTLGASAAIDVIVACETMRRGKTFAIANSAERDSKLQAHYLTLNSELPTGPFNEVLVSSLGFGGLHSALWLRAGEQA